MFLLRVSRDNAGHFCVSIGGRHCETFRVFTWLGMWSLKGVNYWQRFGNKKKKKNMICNYAIIENVNHTVFLEIRFSDSPTCQPQNPVGVPFFEMNIPQLPGCKKKTNKTNKQEHYGVVINWISADCRILAISGTSGTCGTVMMKRKIIIKTKNTLTLFETLFSGIKKITLSEKGVC